MQILLNYLPPDRKEWKTLLEQKRAAYQQFRQELIIDPKKQDHSAAADHPLSQSSDSKWNAYFKVCTAYLACPGVHKLLKADKLSLHGYNLSNSAIYSLM